ncbi:pitrilysin family protein [Cyclobacterium sp. 1_MG-2023]|uniref:M16 family metallopeptidase n=1 Tax=Cyclobacterium sp. 1_MG-2023 TaxID=3062681 RepID=UPI0026E32092|nr:pitrilysin family protein [Cyclobacterium sp. 1_MG-2023]MDO6436425.1 pitrilysin family protein [Cyclobacterium sp. 1_MG-2023]|eukprot:TRINITY_DN21530_c0_g1_i1.p1 TRINITY_DN21530_c0_g1~~TRINITY_DN21530_c0_g1_i1.p1  ORF type:complete len:426 (-),score=-14.34 TRINITY_DN21530_c0_g1_i1:225-1502(-)
MSIDRSLAPPYSIPEKIHLTPPEKRVLPNGTPIYYIPFPNIDAIKIEVVFPINNSKDQHSKPLQPFFMLYMLLEGTKTMNSEKLDDFFDFHASEVDIISGYERQGLSLLTTKKHLLEVLPVFRSLFTEAVFPEKELNKRKSQKKLSISIKNEQTSARANQLIRKSLFEKDHPFGYQVTEDDVDEVQQNDLIEYYEKDFLLSPQIFLTGQLSDKDLNQIELLFSDLPLSPKTPHLLPTGVVQSSKLLEKKPEALQSSIRIAKWMIPKSHPDYPALSVLNTLLGGYFGSRLIKNIREEKGYTYGINSFLGELNGNEYWMTVADVKGGYGEAVIQEVYKEIERLKTEPVPAGELEIIKNYLAGSILANFSSPFDQMSHFQHVHFQGLNFDYYTRHLDYIKNFDGRDIMTMANRYFNEKEMLEVIVGAG